MNTDFDFDTYLGKHGGVMDTPYGHSIIISTSDLCSVIKDCCGTDIARLVEGAFDCYDKTFDKAVELADSEADSYEASCEVYMDAMRDAVDSLESLLADIEGGARMKRDKITRELHRVIDGLMSNL